MAITTERGQVCERVDHDLSASVMSKLVDMMHFDEVFSDFAIGLVEVKPTCFAASAVDFEANNPIDRVSFVSFAQNLPDGSFPTCAFIVLLKWN